MEGFQVTEIGEKIYCILDAGNSSFYVVEGEEKAAVIDTGITAGAKILPVIRELTDKPLLLVITHAHPDHMYHIDEFDEVYMCHEEKKMDSETLVMLTAGKLKPWEEIPYRFRDSARRYRAGRLSDTGPYAGQRRCAGNETELPVHRRCDRKRLRCLDTGAGRNEPGRVLRRAGRTDGVACEEGRPHEILRRSSHAGV